MKKLIYLEDAIDAVLKQYLTLSERCVIDTLKELPSAEPYTDEEIQKMQELEQAEIEKSYELGRKEAEQEIIRCKDCENWKVQVKDTKGDGLGCCTFHKANFVTGEGYCYWAERRTDE